MLISKSKFSLPRRLCLLALLIAACAPALFAQVLQDVIYTVGTTAKDASNRDWAYVLWQGTVAPDLMNKHFAIYAKAGNAASLNPYTRQSVVGVQTEPAVIQVILNRAHAAFGEDLGELENRINNLFQKIMPPGTWTLAEKVSIVIRGSMNDPNYFNNLIILAHLHPSISMALGMAHAAMIPVGDTTFEVREFDFAAQKDVGVVGRVTVTAGIAIELPAPTAPVQVPDNSAKGDLNAKFRWGTSDDLRRLSLLNYGFNFYRVTKTYAEAHNFHITPPTNTTLVALSLSNSNVVQLNHQPILKNKDYTLLDVGNFGLDPTNAFFNDDNRRYEPGGVAFNNGDKFYYFVAARDVLGRIGKVSPGTLVTICDKLPPNAPVGVTVINDYHFVGGVSKQVLKVQWKQDTQETDQVKAYYVYRWQGPDQVQALAGNPLAHRIAGPILHVPGQKFNSYVDDGAGAPAMPADASKTFWYTVRSEDTSACGGNLSPNSGPAFGVLRDRVGPDAPGGYVDLLCRHPIVIANKIASVQDQQVQDQNNAYYTVVCNRHDSGIDWADFYAFDTTTPSNYLGRVHYKSGDLAVSVPYVIARAALANERQLPFYCRVGSTSGKISNFAALPTVGTPKVGENWNILFDASTVLQPFRPSPNFTRKGDCFRHDPTGPGGTNAVGTVTPIDVTIILTPGTKEYKLYRRVDFGQLTLVKEGPADFDNVSQITIPDDAMPPNAGTICYYGQLFDEHGNPSPLTLISDDCIIVAGTTPLPAPMLATPEIIGTEASPKMNVKWFCPPYGVDRFLVHISVDPPPMPASITSELSDYLSSTPDSEVYTLDSNPHTNDFWTYKTPRVGPGFGNGAQFDVDINVVQGKKYTIFITALGKDDSEGPKSNVEDATWTPAVAVGPKVPWPARPLPPFNLFTTNLVAERLPPAVFDGLGVRIGMIFERTSPKSDNNTQPFIYSDKDPMTYVYTNAVGDKLFPVTMYRVQLANAAFPKVSGDVVQVTPMMESIAFNRQTVNGVTIVNIVDPFVALGYPIPGATFSPTPMYLLDTQPVVLGATYVYLLVRFDPFGEIKEVVPSSAVVVTP